MVVVTITVAASWPLLPLTLPACLRRISRMAGMGVVVPLERFPLHSVQIIRRRSVSLQRLCWPDQPRPSHQFLSRRHSVSVVNTNESILPHHGEQPLGGMASLVAGGADRARG
uniref:Putative secreted protein n=1 Tax=Anopheles darlingi TaxID=43151 RepID=A0A2M4DQU0_ANODA